MRTPPRTLERWAARLCDVSAAVGTLVYFVVGPLLALTPPVGGRDAWWQTGVFGPFFLPTLVLAVVSLDTWRTSVVGRTVTRGWRRVNRLSPTGQRLLLLGAVVALGAARLGAVVSRYLSFRAAMDLAIYANACRGALHASMKGDASLLADHFEPLLLLFTPLCRSVDPALALLFVGVAAWCIGAVGAYQLALASSWSRPTALVAAVLYLHFAGFAGTIDYDFHLDELTIGLTPWMWLALLRRRFVLLWCLALLSLGLKESAALSLVGFGAYLSVASHRSLRWTGAGMIVLGATVFYVIMTVVFPHYRQGAQNFYFLKYYAHLGHDLPAFVRTAVTRPLYFVSTLLTGPKILYVTLILAPFAFVPLLRPAALLALLPALFINVASNDPHMFSGDYHYEAEIHPTLFASMIVITRDPVAIRRARSMLAVLGTWVPRARLQRVSLRFVWLAVLTVAFSGAGPFWAAVRWRPEPMHRYLDRMLTSRVPRDVKVAANQKVAAHLTSRPSLYTFDYWAMEDDWKKADMIVIAAPVRDLGWYDLDWIRATTRQFEGAGFMLVYQDSNVPEFRIWRRASARGAW